MRLSKIKFFIPLIGYLLFKVIAKRLFIIPVVKLERLFGWLQYQLCLFINSFEKNNASTPDDFVAFHQNSFAKYWTDVRHSTDKRGGRPPLTDEVIQMIHDLHDIIPCFLLRSFMKC